MLFSLLNKTLTGQDFALFAQFHELVFIFYILKKNDNESSRIFQILTLCYKLSGFKMNSLTARVLSIKMISDKISGKLENWAEILEQLPQTIIQSEEYKNSLLIIQFHELGNNNKAIQLAQQMSAAHIACVDSLRSNGIYE